jgi:uncharacterized protein YjiS (DUF1127 family)
MQHGLAGRRRLNVQSTLANWFVRVVETVLEWQDRARMRQALLHLDERLLKDMGLNRIDVVRETEKPFWRV